MALALARGRRPGGSGEALDTLLETQARLVDPQIENLSDDRILQHRHLALKYFGDRLRVGLQLLAIAFGLAVIVGLAAMVVSASEDHGLDPLERAWAHLLLGLMAGLSGDAGADALEQRAALNELPGFAPALKNLQGAEFDLGHDEDCLWLARDFARAGASIRESRWREAVAKFDAALVFAPRWAALQRSLAAAATHNP